MFTQKRLTDAYISAKKIYFDSNSKYVFFSDSHRGDDSISDEFARNQVLMVSALKYYNVKEYTYVECGDGDDLWEYKEFRYIRAAHTDVFTVLKEFYNNNRMIMLYGNHNNMLRYSYYVKKNYYYFYDEYENAVKPLFVGLKPIEALLLIHKRTGQQIFAVHGHQGDLLNDRLWGINMVLLRFFWRYMHLVGFKNPASPAKNQFKRHKVEKDYIKWLEHHNVCLICGHTHRMKYPKPGQAPYFNSGCGIHTKGITCIELESDKISLVQWRVEADCEGKLTVDRRVIRGPNDISDFDTRRKGRS